MWSSPRNTVRNSMGITQCSSSCSECKTQFRVDALTPVTNRKCTAATRKTAMKTRWPTATLHRTHTDKLVHTFPTNNLFVPSGRFRHFLAGQQARRKNCESNQRVQSQSLLRGQPAPKPVDVVGPSDPRTHVFACPVAAVKRSPFALSSDALPCRRSFGSGTAQRHAAVACRLFFWLPSTRRR